jgi:Predicted metal-dependent hydrolase of the TIM-barrel fold
MWRGRDRRYRTPDAQRLDTLRALGVRAFSALAYPHKPAMAAWLNEWTTQFAAEVPECLSSATFYPEPGMDEQIRTMLERGVDVVKAHLQVGAYDPRNPLLDRVWGLLAEAGTPVVCHCGSGPQPGQFTGPGPISEDVPGGRPYR